MSNKKLIRLIEEISDTICRAKLAYSSLEEPLNDTDKTIMQGVLLNLTNMDSTVRDMVKRRQTMSSSVQAVQEAPSASSHVIKKRRTFVSTYRQHTLSSDITPIMIREALGFLPEGGCDKTTHEWNFWFNDKACAIWDFHGGRWSAYGPREAFEALGFQIVDR